MAEKTKLVGGNKSLKEGGKKGKGGVTGINHAKSDGNKKETGLGFSKKVGASKGKK